MYCCKCPENNCDDFHIGETDRRISERITDHNKRDKKSHPLQHLQNMKDTCLGKRLCWSGLTGFNYRSKIKRNISESLYIKSKKPTLNIKETSMKLNLFN